MHHVYCCVMSFEDSNIYIHYEYLVNRNSVIKLRVLSITFFCTFEVTVSHFLESYTTKDATKFQLIYEAVYSSLLLLRASLRSIFLQQNLKFSRYVAFTLANPPCLPAVLAHYLWKLILCFSSAAAFTGNMSKYRQIQTKTEYRVCVRFNVKFSNTW